ncbi:MAG: CBS domain-containing protein [Candidatus Viridilinea halotolerans]|uniref:CBS domain-containing protein n=1 Tax=Candidatus Viridilinea halotolerans TaxID=2491704 RepID=A0A426TVK6_9CHLR|nr:MAG: CBS domain-containing protein [Candidatus Viridilinea halotolerans]
MAAENSLHRVRIYLARGDQWEGGVRYLAIMEQLRRGGATGATALSGLVGFGPGQGSASALAERTDGQQPVVIEWLDRVETIRRLLPALRDLLGDDLVTVEKVPVFQATLRSRGPFSGERGVADVMLKPPPGVSADTRLEVALAKMARDAIAVLPVVTAEWRMVGLLTKRDLAWRADVRLAPSLLAQLSAAERGAILAAVAERQVGQVMSAEPGSVGINTAIQQALATMVEWGYPQIPVVDPNGHVVGLLGQHEVLRELLAQANAAETEQVREVNQAPTPVHLVMQSAVHQVTSSQQLNVALARLLAAPERHILVVDDGGRLVGQLSALTALQALQGEERATFLKALCAERPPAAGVLPGKERSFQTLIEAMPPVIGPQDPLLEAARRLIEFEVEQLAVVNEERQLLGIIARGGLIRALIQQSE